MSLCPALGTYPQGPYVGSFRYSFSRFPDKRLSKNQKNRKCTEMTSDWPRTLNGKRYPAYTKYLPLRPTFWSVLFYDVFRYKVVEYRKNRKCTEWPQMPLNTTVKILCIHQVLSPEANNFRPFCATTSHFQDTRKLKIGKFGNALNNLRLTLKS